MRKEQAQRPAGRPAHRVRSLLFFPVLAALLVLTALWYLFSGSADIPVSKVLAILGGADTVSAEAAIVWQIRLPRLFAALILGGALSVSGYLLQTFFGNPIAGPYVLGISSGAKLAVALTMIFLLSRGVVLSSLGMILAAFAGSLVTMGFVLLISLRVRNMSVLVVCGVMVGYLTSAITDFVVTFADDSNIVNLHNWSQGSFSGTSWEDVRVMAVLTALCVLAAFFLAKPIRACRMGETYAAGVGVNIRLLRVELILLSSILSATVTAFAGPISFVGIAVPHLVRTILGTSEPMRMIPGSFLLGSVLTLLCDGLARSLFAPTEISISTVTAVFFVPVVIAMMLKQGKGSRA